LSFGSLVAGRHAVAVGEVGEKSAGDSYRKAKEFKHLAKI